MNNTINKHLNKLKSIFEQAPFDNATVGSNKVHVGAIASPISNPFIQIFWTSFRADLVTTKTGNSQGNLGLIINDYTVRFFYRYLHNPEFTEAKIRELVANALFHFYDEGFPYNAVEDDETDSWYSALLASQSEPRRFEENRFYIDAIFQIEDYITLNK